MRHVNKRAVAEDIGQAAGTIIRLRDFLRRPNVSPPSQKLQRKEASDDDCKNGCQNPPSHFYTPGPLHSQRRSKLDLEVNGAVLEQDAETANSVEITLERSRSADVQCHAMSPAAKKFGVPQLERDDIETFLLQKPYQRRLISIDYD
jgi:hypothetical protein